MAILVSFLKIYEIVCLYPLSQCSTELIIFFLIILGSHCKERNFFVMCVVSQFSIRFQTERGQRDREKERFQILHSPFTNHVPRGFSLFLCTFCVFSPVFKKFQKPQTYVNDICNYYFP